MKKLVAVLLSIFVLRAPLGAQAHDEVLDRGIGAMLRFTKDLVDKGPHGIPMSALGNVYHGLLALQVYTLLVCDVSLENPIVAKSFKLLEDMDFSITYCTATYIFALDAAIAHLEEEQIFSTKKQRRNREPVSYTHLPLPTTPYV